MSEYVFCDLDETLIDCKTMFEAMKFYFVSKNHSEKVGLEKFSRFVDDLFAFANKFNTDRASMNRYFYSQFKGISVEELQLCCQEWFAQYGVHLLNPKVVAELREHQRTGKKICLVSGSFEQCIAPIVEYLNYDDFLCIQLDIKDGYFTGRLRSAPVIGDGKARAIECYQEKVGNINFNKCFAYGDHISDLPMLTIVGNPVVVSHCKELVKFATENDWRVI